MPPVLASERVPWVEKKLGTVKENIVLVVTDADASIDQLSVSIEALVAVRLQKGSTEITLNQSVLEETSKDVPPCKKTLRVPPVISVARVNTPCFKNKNVEGILPKLIVELGPEVFPYSSIDMNPVKKVL